MSETPLPPSITGRLSTALTFAFVGPFFGSAAIFLLFLVIALFSLNANLSALFGFLFGVFGLGYIYGFGPALVAGIIYALLPGALQRLVLAPFYGAFAVWLFYAIATLLTDMSGIYGIEILMFGAGAVAALACAWIVRKSGWAPDHRRAPAAV